MALTLYLLRHAKAVVADGSIADFDRPLAARGHRESEDLAVLLAERSYAPARVICSSAQRTRETLAPLLAAWPVNSSIEITRELYNADANRLLALVGAQDGGPTSLMLVGHNPGIEQLARALAANGDDAALRRLRDHYPPAGFAVIDFDLSSWAEVRPGAGRLSAYETPRA
jgi:phosphohistidine phosphatase